jgi:hypothetical protein
VSTIVPLALVIPIKANWGPVAFFRIQIPAITLL